MEVIYLKGQQLHIDQPICTALGFFDGLHIGHMALVNKVIDIADKHGYKKALMTFDHHPLFVLGLIDEEKYLTTMEDRIAILESLGIDYLFVIEFNKEVASLKPHDFVDKYLISQNIKHVVCGFDFKFGDKNSGNAETLKTYNQFETTVIDEVVFEGEKISSSRIRYILENGHIKEINHLLGRKYCITGQVIKGRQIGKTIGFPTANVDYNAYFLPCGGVYVTKVYIQDREFMGMCNIGYNPTFSALDKPSLEVYILDFDEDIYGCVLNVEFYELIRKEKPFHSKDELINQLNKDKEYVRDYFKTQE
ncbi:MAG: bifunctional riboflavin kinase/FAD synthetase [Coprobacillus sp.]